MPDVSQNIPLEIMRLNLRKQQVQLSHTSMELRLAELDDEKRRVSENFPLYEKEMQEIDEKIAEYNTFLKQQK